jgi:hypothetical protein
LAQIEDQLAVGKPPADAAAAWEELVGVLDLIGGRKGEAA